MPQMLREMQHSVERPSAGHNEVALPCDLNHHENDCTFESGFAVESGNRCGTPTDTRKHEHFCSGFASFVVFVGSAVEGRSYEPSVSRRRFASAL